MSTKAKERPILFSGPMVLAILDGRKTQTRRVVKFVQFDRSDTPGYDWHFRGTAKGTKKSSLWQDLRHNQLLDICPYGKPGDRLWVLETWNVLNAATSEIIQPKPRPGICALAYAATEQQRHNEYPNSGLITRWRPSIHMPRWASRIDLEIIGIRVERLNEISEKDAIAEGAERPILSDGCVGGQAVHPMAGSYAEGFRTIWESINGPDSWSANPWVWVVEFKRLGAT